MNFGLVLVLFLSSCVFAKDETTPVTDEKDNKLTILKPTIEYMEYNTDIQHRYAKTVVSSNVVNPVNASQEVHFSVVLPEAAFISGFVMIIKDKEYNSYIKEKEEKKQIYNQAVAAGQSAAHIQHNVRDSNHFQISVNVEAEGKITFKLTYEELLIRTLGSYVHTVNVNPGQIVKNLTVKVKIEEPVAITKLKVPNFRTENDVVENEEDNPKVKIERDTTTPNKAVIIWSPTGEEQMYIAEKGLQGQFIVEYDVDREKSSQILLDEGYFVHFFTPDSSAPSLSKHVIFILDISASMYGRKIRQLKQAMIKILNDLHGNDYFSIILFASDVVIWSPIKTQYLFTSYYRLYDYNNKEISSIVEKRTGDEIVSANLDNVNNAKQFIRNIRVLDATNIIGGLREGIKIANEGQTKFTTSESDKSKIPQPIIVFLTDGAPNIEVSDPNVIVNITSSINEIKAPIYSLAFGDGADLQFLRRLSLKNYGFARNIYKAADAKLQLSNFYKEISSPLMADVQFSYLPGQVENGTLTKRHFPILFNGSEIVIAGKLSDTIPVHDNLTYEFNSGKTVDNTDYNTVQRCTIVKPHHHEEANHKFGHLEKLWAYLTIKQLLDKDTLNEDTLKEGKSISDEKEEALRLALKYSFVTPLTSLVVVKPNKTSSTVNPEKASSSTFSSTYSASHHLSNNNQRNLFYIRNFGNTGNVRLRGYSGNIGNTINSGLFGNYGNIGNIGFGIPRTVFSSSSNMMSDPSNVRSDIADDDFMSSSSDEVDSILVSTAVPEPPPTYHKPIVNTVPLETLSWLNKVDESSPLIIDIPSHGNYTVGLNQTDVVSNSCQLPNKSEQGHCRHLQYCALSSFVTSITEYVPYFCDIAGGFAGVCCLFLPVTH